MYDKVILPTDGSDLSFLGVEEGLEAAKKFDIPALAVYVIPPGSLTEASARYRFDEFGKEMIDFRNEQLEKEGKKVLEEVKKKADEREVSLKTTIEEGEPFEEITKLAGEKDIIFISSHGRSGISKLLLGSTTSKILNHTHATIAVVRAKSED